MDQLQVRQMRLEEKKGSRGQFIMARIPLGK